MSIQRSDVLHVARLARLSVDESMADRLATDLDQILAYVKLLDELDTDGVPLTAQVSVDQAPTRVDEPRSSLNKDVVLSQAPRADEVGFLVPGFVDETGGTK